MSAYEIRPVWRSARFPQPLFCSDLIEARRAAAACRAEGVAVVIVGDVDAAPSEPILGPRYGAWMHAWERARWNGAGLSCPPLWATVRRWPAGKFRWCIGGYGGETRGTTTTERGAQRAVRAAMRHAIAQLARGEQQ